MTMTPMIGYYAHNFSGFSCSLRLFGLVFPDDDSQ